MPNLINIVMLCIVGFVMAIRYPTELTLIEQVCVIIQGLTYIVIANVTNNENVKLAFSYLSFQLLHINTAIAFGLVYVMLGEIPVG